MKKIKLTYAGARVMADDTVSHCFVHGKKEYFWKRSGWAAIGSVMYAEQSGDKISMDLKQLPTERIEQIPEEWVDKDVAAREFKKRRSELKKAKSLLKSHFKALDPLRTRMEKLSYFEKRDFIMAVGRYLVTGQI